MKKQRNRNYLKDMHISYYGKIKVIFERYFKNNNIEKIVEDCFIKIFNNLEKTKNIDLLVKKETINTIILNIQKNKTIYKLSNQYSDFKEFESEESFFCEDLSAEMCLQEIKNLNDLERFVFNLIVFEEFSIEEASEILKINKEICKKALHASKQNLKESLFELIQIE
jgi:DNA-directed RNA polymerase specialized sigma24 family protein